MRQRRNVRMVTLIAALAFAFGRPHAALALPCAHADEVDALRLRHLQSRLMVAGLACNQSDAYNTFVQHFQMQLAEGGRQVIAYFKRTGGGGAGLNRYVTELANAAGLSRAADPKGYCNNTWDVFWELEQTPHRLPEMAEQNLVTTVHLPAECAARSVPVKKTAARRHARAAVE